MPRAGQVNVLGDDRLTDRIAVGMLTSAFPPALVDEVLEVTGRGSWRVPTSGAITQGTCPARLFGIEDALRAGRHARRHFGHLDGRPVRLRGTVAGIRGDFDAQPHRGS